jgi:ribosome biogenesis GTPase A
MGKQSRVLRCYHCGAILQCENENEKGYIIPESLHRATPIQIIYCDRCFETMKAFNNSELEQKVDQEVLKILDDAFATDALIIWVVDLFSFNGTLNSEIAKKVKKLNVIVVGNKRDLFPLNVKDESLVEYLNVTFNAYGIKPKSVRLLGATNKIDSKELIDSVNTARKGHDVYMIGNSTSGKTSIINRAMKGFENKTSRQIKTITYPGTNVNVLEIPLSRSSFFYELPGISQTTSATGKLEKDVVRQIVPKKAVKLITRTMSAGDALMVGSLAAFEIIKGKTTNYRFYSAEGVETRKVQSKKLDDYINENNIRRFARPVSERLVSFLDYDMFEYAMENDKKWHDIAIEGLGWLSFIAQGQMIRVRLPKGVALKESIAKIK